MRNNQALALLSGDRLWPRPERIAAVRLAVVSCWGEFEVAGVIQR